MERNVAQNTHNKQVGKIGEEITAKYLKNKGFEILAMNYLKKWGEIDVVARGTDKKVHFVEVKTVSYETKQALTEAVTRRTWRPEENVHAEKLRRLSRAIESWLMEYKYNGDWQIDVMAVRIVPREKFGTAKYIPNIIV
ncbi:MAG: YraN family protein [Candidatus Paceibacterota bacterium]